MSLHLSTYNLLLSFIPPFPSSISPWVTPYLNWHSTSLFHLFLSIIHISTCHSINPLTFHFSLPSLPSIIYFSTHHPIYLHTFHFFPSSLLYHPFIYLSPHGSTYTPLLSLISSILSPISPLVTIFNTYILRLSLALPIYQQTFHFSLSSLNIYHPLLHLSLHLSTYIPLFSFISSFHHPSLHLWIYQSIIKITPSPST